VLQHIVLPPTILSSPSHPLSPSVFAWPLLTFPYLSPQYPLLLHIHHPLTSLLYQLYTPPALWNPWHKHPLLQQQNYTQTQTRAPKPSSSNTSSHTHPTPPFNATFTNYQSFYLCPNNHYPPQLPLFIEIITKRFST
jgi:hypothetical protein